MQHAVAVVLVGVALLVLAAVTSLTYGLTVEYGDSTVQGLGWLVLVLVPAGLALLCLLGARDPVGPPRPRTSVLAVGVVVVFAATVTGAQAYGGLVHERNREARTAACSPEDVALLTAVDAPGAHSEPLGDEDGGCSVVVSWVPDVAVATAAVVSSLERGGWQPTGSASVFRRGDAVLQVSAGSDGKATEVRLTLPQAAP